MLAPLIPLLVGRGFAESVSALRWLCLIPVFRSIHGATGSVLTGAGLQRYRSVTQIMAAVGNFGIEPVVDTEPWLAGGGVGKPGHRWGFGLNEFHSFDFLCRSTVR